VIILKILIILVVIRFHRCANGSIYFVINAKTLLGLFCNSNCIHLCSHITLSFSSNMNIVEWLVSMPAVRLFVGSALTISFGLACSAGLYNLFAIAGRIGFNYMKYGRQ